MRTSQEHKVLSTEAPASISVIIPALNAAAGLERTLCLDRRSVLETIVVDGGSTDHTVAIAESMGAAIVQSAKGRGTQLRAGAIAAAGDWLLFLHADTRLGPDWHEAALKFTAVLGNQRRAAAYRFRVDDESAAAWRLERMVAWRCRKFGLPYGDQGLLIHRSFYEELGGFKPIPLMEDVDLVRRIGRQNIEILDADAMTSAARFKRNGYWLRPVRNLVLVSLYWAGVPPRWLAMLYG